jgi:hypothetical protein
MTTENNNKSLKSFVDEDWNTDHMDEKLKLILLLNSSKFTTTLDNILNNDVNVNVLIDNTNDTGLVYYNGAFTKMKIKDIAKKTMEKVLKQLTKFRDEFVLNNKYNIDRTILDNEITITQTKFEQYLKDENIFNAVNKYLADIYNKKRVKTY